MDFGLFCRIYAVKGKEISIFLEIWTRKYVYLWNLTCTWSDTIRPCKISIGMHRVVKLKISRIPLIGLETRLGWRTDRKFLRNPNLNEIIGVQLFQTCNNILLVFQTTKNKLKKPLYLASLVLKTYSHDFALLHLKTKKGHILRIVQ